jgi:hypothetical protein
MSWRIVGLVCAILGLASVLIATSAHIVGLDLLAVVLIAIAAIAMLMMRRSRTT